MADKTVSVVLGAKDKMSAKLKSASKSTSLLSKNVGSLKGAMKGIAAGSAVIGAGVVAIAALAAKGEDLRTLEGSFNSLAQAAGASGGEMLSSMQAASEGLISNFDLIKNSNRLLAAGIPATAEQMGDLANSAKRLGIGLGVGAAEAMNTLSSALATGKTTALATMGVIVDSKKAVDDYAAANNRTTESLTEVEKKTAVFEATMTATNKVIENMGDFSVGLGGQVDQLKVSFANFFDDSAKFASAFGDSFLLAFGEAFGATEKLGAGIKFNAELMTNFAKKVLTGAIDGFILIALAVENLLAVFNLLQTAIGFISGGFADLFDSILGGAQEAVKAMAVIAEKIAPSQAAGFKKTAASIQGMRDSVISARDAMNDWGAEGLADIDANRAAMEKLTEGAGKLKTSIQNIPASQITDFMTNAADESERMETATQGAATAAASQAASAAAVAEAATKAADAAATAEEVRNAATIGIAGALASGDAKASLASLFEGVSVAGFDIGAILQVITSLNKELPSMLFESIKSLLVNVIQELPLLIGNIIPDLLIPLMKLIPTVIDGFVDNLPVMIDSIIKSIPALVEALVNLMFQVLIANGPFLLVKILNSAFEMWLGQGYIRVRDRFIADLQSAGTKMLDKIQEAFPAAWGAMGEEIQAWWQRTIWADLTEKLGEKLAEFADMFNEKIIQPIFNAHVEAAEQFISLMTDFWDATFGAFPDIVDDAVDRMNEPFDRIVDQLNDIAGKLGVGGSGGTAGKVIGEAKSIITQATGLSFATGTDFVPRTGMYQLHKGEQVIPAKQTSGMKIENFSMPISVSLEMKGGHAVDVERVGQEVVRQIVHNVKGSQDKIRNALARKGL